MDEKRHVDYFIVSGLPEHPEPIEDYSEEVNVKPNHKQDPIIDIVIINKTLGELPPKGYKCVEFTPSGFPADLNHGSIRAPEVSICYKRGRDKSPLTDIGVLYDGKERIMSGCEVIYSTPYGRTANVNNSNSSRIYITFRRMDEFASCGTLAVTDICIILQNKGETAPHAFCLIEKNLNKAMVGSDVYLCYKKSVCKSNVISYKPAILGRYPLQDYPGLTLPERVPMFCLPLGATLESWPAKSVHPLPQFSTFVLTMEFGEKVYGASVSFYEEVDKSKLAQQQKQQLGLTPTSPKNINGTAISPGNTLNNETTTVSNHSGNASSNMPSKDVKAISRENNDEKTVHESKCICVLSRWPFFDTFKRYLSYLYRVSVSGPQEVPIERLISHFMHEVPFPSPQRPQILVQFNGIAISLAQPEDTPLAQSGASFISLLKNLGAENCMMLLTLTLFEYKILIHSLRHAVLTSAAEAVTSMVFPFQWQCPYIPLCPLGLSGVLCAPTPFIVGVDSRYFDLFDPPSDIVCVDLDTNSIKLPEDKKGITHKLLPKKPAKIFRATLDKLFEKLCESSSDPSTPIGLGGFEADSIDMDFSHRRREMVMETAIQEAFLRFMACVLKGYNQFLLPITRAPTSDATDLSSLFDIQGFLKTRDKTYQKFFTPLMKTQLFTRFIEERSFVSDKDASLAFFDECTEKINEYSDEPRLLELDDASKSERTVFILPPEPTGLPEGATYNYEKFPILDRSLFPEKTLPNPLVASLKATPCPNSPMTKRTKQEVKSAQKIALQQNKSPQLWAKCLLGHCYSLWFIHLPSYVKTVHSKTKALRTAYEVLVKMQSAKLHHPDEVCYRVLLHLCGLYQQPVLAVKVLFEMRQHGVQPNAITYGFYNKAVLESKWPTSDTNAFLLWTKVKHTIQAIAQFKQGLKNRRSSTYSNSESECDGISRTSTDSFFEDIVPLQDRVDGTTKDIVISSDLVNVESPNCEERVSTGGMSDKGYSSMTLDDSKRASLIISSEDSIDSLERVTVVMKPPVVIGSTDSGVEMRIKRSNILKKTSGKVSPNFESIDPKTDAAFQEKIGSIVRKSNGSIGSTSTLRGSTCSSAGLLMTSQASIDESVFGDYSFSQNLKHKRTSSLKNDPIIRRHSGEKQLTVNKTEIEENRRKSDKGCFSGSTLRDSPIQEVEANLKRLTGEQLTPKPPYECVQGQHLSKNGEKIVNDGYGDNETISSECNSQVKGSSSHDLKVSIDMSEENCSKNGSGDSKNNVVNFNHQQESRDTDDIKMSGPLQDVTPVKVVNADLVDLDKTPTKNCASPSSSENLIEYEFKSSRRRSDSDRLSECSETSLKSLTSPSHSIRTPVLENDPLGLFTPQVEEHGGKMENKRMISPSPKPNRGLLQTKHDKLSIDLGEPFSGTSTPLKSGSRRSSEATSHGQSNEILTNSFSSSDASSPGSPIKEWQPLSVSHSENTMPRDKEEFKDNLLVKKRASTLPSDTNPPNFGNNLASEKRGKFVGRSDSFMKSMKSAASGFMTRFNTLKETVTTTGNYGLKDNTGSTGSLPKAILSDKENNSTLDSQQKKKSSSLDVLGTASDDEELLNEMATDDTGQSNRLKSARGYTPFVRNLMGDLANKTVKASNNAMKASSSAMKSMHKGLVSMKESVIDSFSENWAISDDSDDEYYETAGYNSNRSTLTDKNQGIQQYSSQESLKKGSATNVQDVDEDRVSNSSGSKKGSAPPHSVLDNYIPVQEDTTDKGSDKGSVKQQSSVQSIPQLFFNCAIEVEMCSLSRCNSCNALLYDEDVMAGWSADDSNLNSSCQFCNSKLVPQIQIYVKDYRQFTEPVVMKASQSMESMHSIHSMPTCLHRVATAQSNLLTTQPNRSVNSVASADNVLLSNNGHQHYHPEVIRSSSNNYPSQNNHHHFNVQSSTHHQHNANTVFSSTTNNNHHNVNTVEGCADNDTSNSSSSGHTDNTANNNKSECMFENSLDIPDISAVPKLANINRSSAVRLKTEDHVTSSNKVKNLCTTENKQAGTVTNPNVQLQVDDNIVQLNSEQKSDSIDTLDDDGSESLPSNNVDSPVTDSVDAETDSIGDVLEDELPENRDLKEPKCKSITLEPISVQYLSPLVLRKEVENVITQEGDDCLAEDKFMDEHPIIYWNLIWFFKRTDIPSHLPGFMLTAKATNKDQPPPKAWAKADSRHVQIRTVWDNLRIQELELGKPMYVCYGQTVAPSSTVNALLTEAQIFSKGTLQHIVSSIMCNDVIKPINMVMNDRRKNKHLASKGRFRSIYRDLLFLSFVALGRDNIDHDAFDREFKMAYSCLSQREIARLRRVDGPPKITTTICRRTFGELEL